MTTLRGKRILITRARPQAEELMLRITAAGGVPILFPTIEILPPASWEPVDRALDALYMYDGLLFTSVNSVEAFFGRWKSRGGDGVEMRGKRIFAVGEKTARRIGEAGLPVTDIPERATSHDLAQRIAQEDLTNRAFLFPCGDLSGAEIAGQLRLLGAAVDKVVVYRTVLPGSNDTERVARSIEGDEVDVATFFSPSAFTNFTTLLGAERAHMLLPHLHIAVIGPTTAEAVRAAGYEPAVISPGAAADLLIDAIANFFAQHTT